MKMTEADSRMCSVKKKFLKICKIHRLRSTTLFKKRLLHNRFPVNVAKSLRTSFLQNISGGCLCFYNGSSNTNISKKC